VTIINRRRCHGLRRALALAALAPLTALGAAGCGGGNGTAVTATGYDVVGLSDDAIWAQRLHVVGRPTDSGEGFSLTSVEATNFCDRGGGDGGPCP
jgi:hypothetical protein